jgi:hypothetical protein
MKIRELTQEQLDLIADENPYWAAFGMGWGGDEVPDEIMELLEKENGNSE